MTTNRASTAEEEYFARQEAEHRRERATESQRQAAQADQAERDRLKALHFMRCPKCGMALETLTSQGVEIDRCRSCAGSWLDKGELEQLARREPGLLQKIVGTFRGG
jgi:transposase